MSELFSTKTKYVQIIYDNREILEQLLLLKCVNIRLYVQKAINLHLIDPTLATNEDWLDVVIATFHQIFEQIDLNLIRQSKITLDSNILYLGRIIETSQLNQLIKNNYFHKYNNKNLLNKMSNIIEMVSMEGVYSQANEIFKNKEQSSYVTVS